MSIVLLKRQQVIELYDTMQGDGGFVTAFSALAGEELAVALLEHYLVKHGSEVTRIAGTPTSGRQTGISTSTKRKEHWLDAWLDIDGQLAQVEVKNWGANSVGKAFSSKPNLGWQQFAAWFRGEPSVRKVLYPMTPHPSYVNQKVELAIACMWPIMHVSGGADCYFSVDVKTQLPSLDFDTSFDQLHVFSMSAYLHTLHEDVIELQMPKTYTRLQRMETILGVHGFSSAANG